MPCSPPASPATTAGESHDEPEHSWEDTAQGIFDRERRDDAWARPREHYVRSRVERLIRLAGASDKLRVECRSTCCQIDYEDDVGNVMGDLQSSAGIPFTGPIIFMEDRVVGCFERDKPFPPSDFVDRLDDRVALDRIVRAAEALCRGVSGTPGTLDVGIGIAASGEFKLHLSGDIGGTSAAACVENLLYDELHFSAANGPSHLDVTLRIEGP